MEPITLSTIPISASDAWAKGQAAFDQMVTDGLASVQGTIETALAHHVRVCNVDLILPQIAQLMGTFQRVRWGWHPKPKELRTQRDFYRYQGTPHIGTDEEREALKARILEKMKRPGTEGGLILIQALEITQRDLRDRQIVKNNMACMAAA